MAKRKVVLKPPCLVPDDTVMLIAPSHKIDPTQLQVSTERMQSLNLNVIIPNGILDSYGYFSGTVAKRARDINEAFENPAVKAIFTIRGGSGASLLLEHLNYDLIRDNPKILMGYSDITALLIAIHQQTGLITFHGPNVASQWPQFTVDYIKRMLFENKKCVFKNPVIKEDDLIQTQNRITTLYPGKAIGKLLGGNLTTLSTLMGSKFFPQHWNDYILFIEDTGEVTYRIDRMLAQLKNAGILSQLKGFIAGTFRNTLSSSSEGFHLGQVFERYIQPLKIPAFSGAMIGHQAKQFIIGQGMRAEIDADKGEITMQETIAHE